LKKNRAGSTSVSGRRSGAAVSRGRKQIIAAGVLVLTALIVIALLWYPSTRTSETPSARHAGATPSAYMGTAACESCHPAQTRAWRNSQHAQAMAEATETTVRGRFEQTRVTHAGVTSTFFRRDGKFFVRTEGADGRLTDFEVKYTFGVFPLQQYLIAFPGGRLQALSLAWDTRPADAGGQRWFHLYPQERVTPGDPLHWTGPQQNWNFMCADCHSTNLRKGYDAAARRYQTTWSEISVGCEACHGPGDAHIEWARRAGPRSDSAGDLYLAARLDERKKAVWGIDPATQLPARSKPRASDREIEVCARCHARRTQMTDLVKAGDRFEDGFRASLLEPALFHDDGQQQEEVYTYASFLQSRMYAKGVTCSDCHEPHSGTLKLSGNAVCTQCHLQSRYDAPSHHRHVSGTLAAACVTCHMPSKTYMVVDPRRDHGFRIPRPDLSARLKVPDVCTTACHRSRPPSWAADALESQSGRAPVTSRQFAETFNAATRGAPEGVSALLHLASDGEFPAIVRASALERLTAAGGSLHPDTAPRLLTDSSPLVRRLALAALQQADAETRQRLVPALLSDPIRAVRAQAAMTLLDVAGAGLPDSVRAAFDRALEDHLSEQRFNADRPEAQTNLGTALAMLRRTDESIAAFTEAIALDRTFVPAYINLADVHRAQDNEAAAERVLRQAIAAAPSAAAAHHSLGLSLVRQRRIPEALAALAEAVRLQPESARHSYVYAVALHDTGSVDQALAVLGTSLTRRPFDRDTLFLLASYALEAGRLNDARNYAARLSALEPNSAEVRALLQRLQGTPSSLPGRDGGKGR
jgi:tetratricopeptide (TPR) repeat protein/nitrate/TMAO reductase-like tetraheme cytochrome c subunit